MPPTSDEQHTAGPWKIGRLLKRSFVIVGVPFTKDVCSVTRYEHTDNTANEANARLIAAAPELLEALKAIVEANPAFRSKPIGAPDSIARRQQDAQVVAENMARAAIAKATRGEAHAKP